MPKTIVFDFDGVIHKYGKGWHDGSIYDVCNENVKDCIEKLRTNGYEVVVVSTRCNTEEGEMAIRNWLFDNNIIVDKVCKEKPPAMVYIDDRGLKYDPYCTDLYSQIVIDKPIQKSIDVYSKLSDLEILMLLKSRQTEFSHFNTLFHNKYTKAEDGIISVLLLDEWIKSLKKYL